MSKITHLILTDTLVRPRQDSNQLSRSSTGPYSEFVTVRPNILSYRLKQGCKHAVHVVLVCVRKEGGRILKHVKFFLEIHNALSTHIQNTDS